MIWFEDMPVGRTDRFGSMAVTREEVIDYLRQERLSYRQDSSNLTALYRRNRVRRPYPPAVASNSSSTCAKRSALPGAWAKNNEGSHSSSSSSCGCPCASRIRSTRA